VDAAIVLLHHEKKRKNSARLRSHGIKFSRRSTKLKNLKIKKYKFTWYRFHNLSDNFGKMEAHICGNVSILLKFEFNYLFIFIN
jgi:hypothetical protein